MPSQPALPPLLTPYLSPTAQSAQSLTLITSVLAATSNWLILRYLASVLSDTDKTRGGSSNDGGNNSTEQPTTRKIVLVSFLRNWDFWRAEAKRLGLDLQRLADEGRARFVDGLTGLYSSPPTAQHDSSAPARGVNLGGSSTGASRTIPGRGPAGRAPLAPRLPANASTAASSSSSAPKQLHASSHGSAALDGLEKDIVSIVSSIRSADEDDTLLIVDQPDLLLAATQGINAADVSEWITGLQQHVHSTIITASADSPLVHNAYTAGEEGIATPLETQHSAFVIGLAHQARLVMQLRTLDTGAAKDVSGVLRISKGGGFDEVADGAVEDKEVLYFVQRDGGVRVFGRGEA